MADTGAVAKGVWFIGADITLRFTVYSDAAHTACVDVSGYAMTYALRRRNTDDDPALITKTTGAGNIVVTGVFNATPSVNTQRVLVSILDTDTDTFTSGVYMHSLKRTNDGNETVLMYTDSSTPAILTKAAL